MPADIQLVYFDIRGRAEMLRLMFVASGTPYEEKRIQFGEEWKKEKPNSPYGALPYMFYKGKKYGQSVAMAGFFARELGFYGKTNLDSLRIEEVNNLFEDQLRVIGRYRWAKTPEDKAALKKQALEEDLPRFLGYYENFLRENGGNGYVVGNSFSVADFYLYDMSENLLWLKKDALEPYPLLRKLRQTVEADPKIKAYLATRKQTEY